MEHTGHRFPHDRRAMLMREERRQAMPPERILAPAQLQPGETAVDLGAGPGFWTETLASLVGPTGRIYAVDIEPVMLADLRTLIKERGLSQVEVVRSEETRVPLPDEVADLVLLAFVLHEPDEPEVFLREVVRLLKPTGRVLVVEWEKHPTEHGPPLEARISAEEAKALLGDAGLTVEQLPPPNPDAYVLLGREFHPGDPEPTHPTI